MADRISIEIVADDSGLQTTLRRAGTLLRQFSVTTDQLDGNTRAAHASINKFAQGFRGLVLDLNLARHAMMGFKFAIVDSLSPILKSGAMFERTAALMEGMSKSTDKATRALEVQANTAYLVQKAMSNPFGIEAIQDSMVKLKSIGLDPTAGSLINFNEELRKMHDDGSYAIKDTAVNMQALLDSVANFGGSEDQLKRASVAIQQMAGKGVISMEELRQQLGEAVPNAVQLLANSLNMTYGQLVKNISQGKIKAKPALVMLFREMELSMGGSSARMMKTWDGMMSQFNTSWELFKKNIFDSGFGTQMKTQLVGLTNWLNSPEGINAARGLGEAIAWVTKNVALAITTVIKYKDEIYVIASAFAAFKVAMAMIRFKEFIVGLQAIKAAAITASLAEMTAAMNATPSAMGRMSIAAKGLGASMSALAGPLGALALWIGASIVSWVNEKETILENTRAILANKLARTGDKGAIAEQQSSIDSLAKGIQRAEEQIVRAKKNIALANKGDPGMYATSAANKAHWEQELADSQRLILANNEAIKKLQVHLEGERLMAAQTGAAARLRVFQDEADQVAATAALSYKEQTESLSNQLQAAQEAGKDITKLDQEIATARDAAAKTRLEASINYYSEAIAKVAKEAASANTVELKKELQLTSAALATEKERLQTLLATSRKDFMGQGSTNNTGKNSPEDYLDTLKEKYEVMIAQSKAWGKAQDNTNKEISKAGNEMAKAGKGSQLAADIEKWAKKIDALKPTSDDLGNMFKTLESDSGALEARLVDLDLALSMGDSWDRMTAKGQEYTAMLAKLGSVTGIDVEALRSALMKLKDDDALAASLQRDIDGLRKLREETANWTQETMSDKDKRQAVYNADIAGIAAIGSELAKFGKITEEAQTTLINGIVARNQAFIRENESALRKWARGWEDSSDEMSNAFVSWIDGASTAFADFIVTGKADWKSFETMVLKSIANIIIQKTIAGLVGSAMDFFGGPMPTGAAAKVDAISAPDRVFAMGGIMTSEGSLQLRKYANGGVAKSPQVALFGEGRQPEAYVPLPDGRSIPVTMKGSDKSAAPNISFNLINQSGQNVQAEQSGVRFDGEKIIMDVVLKGMSKAGKFRDGMKSAR